MKNITLAPDRYRAVLDVLNNGYHATGVFSTKIATIKELRIQWAYENPGEKMHLRDAKRCIENLMAEVDGTSVPWPEGPRLSRGLHPVTIRVDDTAELSLDEWELRILTEMGKIGIDEAGRLLDLVTVIRAWSEGKPIGVIGE